MMNFEPMEGFLAVAQPAEVEQVNGLHLPKTVDRTEWVPCEGEVLAVGPGRMLTSGDHAPAAVSVGDYVYWHPMGGAKVKVNGVKLLLLGVDDLYGIRPEVPAEFAVPGVVAGG